MPQLFPTERRKPRRGFTKALVPFFSLCPLCRGELLTRSVDEPALFRHAGFGATRRTIVEVCGGPCHWSRERSVTEVNPRIR